MGASRILTMLPSTPQVESVYLDPQTGILAGIPDSAPALTPESTSLTFDGAEDSDGEGFASSAGEPATGKPHTLLIDGTTLDPTAAIRIAETIHEKTQGGAAMLDAPVSGGEVGSVRYLVTRLTTPGIVAAEAGQLTIMFGSPSLHASSLAIPFLQRMARKDGVIACGGNGAGVGVKVCNKSVHIPRPAVRSPAHQQPHPRHQPDWSCRGPRAGQIARD